MGRVTAVLAVALALFATHMRADIFRWDNGQLIPGTEGITPRPGVDLRLWSKPQKNLRYADLSGGLDLSNSRLNFSWFDNATFAGANLTGASFWASTLANVDLSGALIAPAAFSYTTPGGFTQAQLASTASYQAKDLHGVWLDSNDLTGWDFSGQNLKSAYLSGSTLANANLSGANLTSADLSASTLTNADLSGAVIAEADFFQTAGFRGFTQAQLASTASYQAKDLHAIKLEGNDLTGWDFSGQNLTSAYLWNSTLTNANLSGANLTSANLYSTLTNANLSGAVVAEANLGDTTSLLGFTQAQLVSTASYQAKDLHGIRLDSNDLTGWDFSGQNLASAYLHHSTLTNANLSGANLTSASLGETMLTNADFSGAVIAEAEFSQTTGPRGFTQAQLVSTASYQAKDLHGITLYSNDLTGWDFSGQNLTSASFYFSTLTNANLSGANLMSADFNSSVLPNADLSFADLRGAFQVSLVSVANTRNCILPDALVKGLDLNAEERLLVRDDDGVPDSRDPLPVTVQNQMTVSAGGTLTLVLTANDWGSTIKFQPGIPVQLGGTLELTFAHQADAASQVGHSFRLFDWTGVVPTGQFTVSAAQDWDLSGLYTTGMATLLGAGNLIAGDATGDGQVSLLDFGILKGNFGRSGNRFEGDANGDGRVDLSDFGLLKTNFGKTATLTVPEPSTFPLAALAGLGLVAFRRRSLPVSQG